ncbi:MAG: hypothetical protein HYV76_01400 [Candidatus Vogelbacteria bacterium]|nr:hypothetical protein [Candidatus Vogelbacteria bacterium]
MEIKINHRENKLRDILLARTDTEARRIERYLTMPDLSRTLGSPLEEMVKRVKAVPILADFDVIDIPEIVPASVSFDLFNFAPDHPARSKSDTYYVDDKNILRTHDTVFWYYYLNEPQIKIRIANQEPLGTLCYGKVYRKDEIDRRHMNIFHQMGGWYLVPDSEKTLTIEDLKNALSEIIKSIFGPEIKYRFNPDTFPYTDPSLEAEVEVDGKWVEILGGGMVRKSVLANMDVTSYNGWAFGFGLERLAIISMELPDIRLLWSNDERVKRQLKLGNKFKEVSKYPSVTRDISFIVPNTFVPNNYFDLIRDIGGNLIEEVTLLDKYENVAKFGADKISYTYRIIYRSTERTLTTDEIDPLHQKIETETKTQFQAEIR